MTTTKQFPNDYWALILGASSGFGGTTAVELARRGMNIIGVHFHTSSYVLIVAQSLGLCRTYSAV